MEDYSEIRFKPFAGGNTLSMRLEDDAGCIYAEDFATEEDALMWDALKTQPHTMIQYLRRCADAGLDACYDLVGKMTAGGAIHAARLYIAAHEGVKGETALDEAEIERVSDLLTWVKFYPV